MYKILFVCHGNICRSPMAEFLFKDFVKNMGRDNSFYVESAATSREEIGNRVHYGTAAILDSYHIDYSKKRARQMTKADYDKFDMIVYMDEYNLWNIERIIGSDSKHKCYPLLHFAGLNRDISDPWYTGNFIKTRDDILMGIEGLYSYLIKNNLC